MRQSGASVEIVGAEKRYGTVCALDKVSVCIDSGEFFTLLGPSGSGKSSLLLAIAGFLPLSAGEILLNGRRVDHDPPYKRNIGMVFQHYALFPHMTVFENVAFPLRVRRLRASEIRSRVADALSLVRLEGLDARYPAQLSGGQQQRVAMARAIVFSPPLLLMDEPLGALDRKLRAQMQIELRQLHRALGVTIIYVSHDQEEALTLSDRVAVLRSGRLEQVGTPIELYQRPASPFVADFIGESNFLNGRVIDVGSDGARIGFAGGGFMTTKQAALRLGSRVLVAVRPEQILPVPDGIEPYLRGRVTEIIFLGSVNKLLLESDAGGTIAVTVPTREHASLQVGAELGICWDPDGAVVLSNSADSE